MESKEPVDEAGRISSSGDKYFKALDELGLLYFKMKSYEEMKLGWARRRNEVKWSKMKKWS